MTQWEYKVAQKKSPKSLNLMEERLSETDITDLKDWFISFGKDGWELVEIRRDKKFVNLPLYAIGTLAKRLALILE